MKAFASRLLILVAAVLAYGGSLKAAQIPDWASKAIASRDPAWRTDSLATVLYRSERIVFTSPEVSRYVKTARGVLLANRTGRLPLLVAEEYNPAIDKILTANAWLVDPQGNVTAFGRTDFIDQVPSLNNYFYDLSRVIYCMATTSAEKGSYVVWEISTEQNQIFGESVVPMQFSVPCQSADLEVVPFQGDTLDWHATSKAIAAPVAGSVPGSLRWTSSHVPPARSEDMPTDFAEVPHLVHVRCVAPNQKPLSTSWTEFSRFVDTIMTPQLQITPEVTAAARATTQGLTDRWDKIRAISRYLQKEISYLSVDIDHDNRYGWRPHTPAEVLKCRYGDCKDKATLMVAMLRAIGEDGRVVVLFAGNPLAVREDWPCPYFNHAIVAIPCNGPVPETWPSVDAGALGRMVIFDATDHATPLGVLSRGDQGGFGLIVDSTNGALIRLPQAKPEVEGVRNMATATLAEDGSLSVSATLTANGSPAAMLYQRKYYGGPNEFKTWIEAEVHAAKPTSRDIVFTDKWDPANARFEASVTYTAVQAAERMSETFMTVSPAVLFRGERLQPWHTRQEGEAFLPSESYHEEVAIALPAGYAVEEAPDPVSEKHDGVMVDISYKVEAGKLTYVCDIRREGGIYLQRSYEAIRAVYQKLDDAQRRPVLLRKSV